jgi:flagellar motor switch protein FliM
VELGVQGLRAAVGELTEMTPGTLLPLRRSAAEPASLLVGGVEMFGATPARSGETRVAQVLALEPELDEEDPAAGNKSAENKNKNNEVKPR